MINVLTVCTGNTCRSAMAQELLDDAVDRSTSLGGRVKCTSAGTFACEGAEATEEAVEAMNEIGLSLDGHEAIQFTEEIAEKSNLILAMDEIVYEQMEAIAPQFADRMHTFIGYANGVDGEQPGDEFAVIDPYDEDMPEYRKCVQQLRENAEKIVKRLEQQLEDR